MRTALRTDHRARQPVTAPVAETACASEQVNGFAAAPTSSTDQAASVRTSRTRGARLVDADAQLGRHNGSRMDGHRGLGDVRGASSSGGRASRHPFPRHAYSKGGGPMRPSCFSASFERSTPLRHGFADPQLRGVLMRPQLDADLAHGQPPVHRSARRTDGQGHDFTFPFAAAAGACPAIGAPLAP